MKRKWVEIGISGYNLSISHHNLFLQPANNPVYIYTFGGLINSKPINNIYRIKISDVFKNCGIWEKVEVDGEIPSSRYSYAGQTLENGFIVYGGSNGVEIYNDM